jgi:hypothetical protein
MVTNLGKKTKFTNIFFIFVPILWLRAMKKMLPKNMLPIIKTIHCRFQPFGRSSKGGELFLTHTPSFSANYPPPPPKS